MSFDYVKQYYQMPFLKRGMHLEMDGRPGRVTSGKGAYVMVRFDGMNFSRNCHPQWEMVYYGKDGSIIKDYRKQQEG